MLFLSPLISPSLEHNVINVVYRLLETLRIKVSKPTVKRVLEEHPDYPSMLSISDALTDWKIENIAVKIPIEKLKELPLPFIVQLHNGGGPYFSLIKEIRNKSLLITDYSGQKWEICTDEEFTNKWKGVVMFFEANEAAGEIEYKKKQNAYSVKQHLPLASILIILGLGFAQSILTLATNGWQAWSYIALLTFKSFGCYISGLLIWYEVDKENTALQKVCKAGKKVNCHAVLNSKGAKIFGISWSEIGFFYFSGGFLTLLISGLSISSLSLLAWLNMLALPYIIYSVYYQWKLAKQWCLLCLTVQALLVLEFGVNIAGSYFSAVTLSGSEIIIILFSFLIPALTWFILKPLLISAKESKRNNSELTRLKFNAEVFESMLSRQKAIASEPSGLGITLGNLEGNIKLIKVCNPYCGPCASAHPDIEELLNHNPNLQVQIIFTATNSDEDRKALPVKHLLAIAEKQNEQLTKQALDDWYNAPVKDYQTFASKYQMNGELKKQAYKLEAMSAWCKETGIAYTPTFFVQGYELPKLYHVKDLKYFLHSD